MMLKLIGVAMLATALLCICLIVARKKANPKTSYLMAFINVFLQPFRYLQIGLLKDPVDFERAMRDAIKSTNLSDFGDLRFVENYQVVSELPFYKSLKFSNLGLVMGKLEMSHGMCRRRLRLVDFLKRRPEVEKIPVKSPVFVIGIGRAGTTFIHRLLSLDPTVRSPIMWELMNPVPDVLEEYSDSTSRKYFDDRELRAADARQQIQGRNFLGDRTMENIHEIDSDLPEECIVALSNEIPVSFHYLYSCLVNMTDVCNSLTIERIEAAYMSYKKILQVLTYQIGESENPRAWVLKSPVHSLFIKQLLQVFPDAKFVWPHRNPQKCLSSHCSLVQGMHLMYYERDCLSKQNIGMSCLRENKHFLSECLQALDECQADCVHIKYDDMVSNPVETVKNIYRELGWQFSTVFEQQLNAYLREDNEKRSQIRKKLGVSGSSLNQYSLEEFGLRQSDLDDHIFTSYVKRFGLQELRL